MCSCERSICTCIHNNWWWRKPWRPSNQVNFNISYYILHMDSWGKIFPASWCDKTINSFVLWCSMTEPQPAYSAYREASFGHGIFAIKNRTHAYFSWNRNQDEYAVEADSLWFLNRHWYPVDESLSDQKWKLFVGLNEKMILIALPSNNTHDQMSSEWRKKRE